ncbi:hypothetical protein TNIN_444721, partial [Trichonephila inaurata madagascariensis]
KSPERGNRDTRYGGAQLGRPEKRGRVRSRPSSEKEDSPVREEESNSTAPTPWSKEGHAGTASSSDSAASNNSDTDDEDYVESVAQGENISSNDEEMDEVQCPTSQPKSNGELNIL